MDEETLALLLHIFETLDILAEQAELLQGVLSDKALTPFASRSAERNEEEE